MSSNNTIVEHTFLPKSYFQEQLRSIGGIDAVINSHAATYTNAVIGLVMAAMKKSIPGALAFSTIQGIVAAKYEQLRSLIKGMSKYPDWCIVVKTTYGFTGWGTGIGTASSGYPTYNEVISVEYFTEVGQ
ncbi:hypothetical protein CLOHAE12215_00099 [Clostridium haemolyticum]|uniref:hypothetical protein n=1 Tax=Clostridium haemolyticum TaxID=84025 RepID=UPI001C3C16E3|nr:hypothetical protein [Clostridium haemolyticum]CAG7838752.1 hypothetical protein CLOHAE12215_00099 [Clostridium haemolyticum]